jgi:hypothetical protein
MINEWETMYHRVRCTRKNLLRTNGKCECPPKRIFANLNLGIEGQEIGIGLSHLVTVDISGPKKINLNDTQSNMHTV